MKVLLVTQHYRPDESTTASLLTRIAEELAREFDVLVISGTPQSVLARSPGSPRIVEVRNREPHKGAMLRRGLAMLMFSLRAFVAVIRYARQGDCVFVVTAPFPLPYSVVLAARLRRSVTALILHDLYPDVLVRSGLIRESSPIAALIHALNSWLFEALDAVVTIGRDMERHLLRYRPMTREKIVFIPNWRTLPAGFRPIDNNNPFRKQVPGQCVFGLSGNLGFTHDPLTVLEAARLLVGLPTVGFLLSGWGVGWDKVKAALQQEKLPNVALIDRVPQDALNDLLTAADVWIIPYRKNMSGISVPSRLYNLLAVGRPIVALAEPDAEHSLILAQDDVGWIVPPEDPKALAETIRAIVFDPESAAAKGRRASTLVADRYTLEAAAQGYRDLAGRLLNRTPKRPLKAS